jgi:cell wall-associated NlpC family hydrolase
MKKIFAHFILCIMLVATATSCATAEPLASVEKMPADNQALPSNDINSNNWSVRAREVLVNALSLSGIQYKYGGSTPDTGFDCSGFVRYVFKQAASLTLPRTALAMSQLGTTVPKNQLQPGDLVFFNTLKSTFSHVGIYLGNNRFIHSPSKGGVVRIENLETDYWAKNYNGAQRLDAEQGSMQ